MSRAVKILCVIGSLLLLVTAVFHATGYSEVSEAISGSDASAFLKRAVPGLWVHFSIHLIVLAAFGVVVSFSAHRARSLMALLALAVAGDAAFVFALASFFTGVALLIATALCFGVAALAPNNSLKRTAAGRLR